MFTRRFSGLWGLVSFAVMALVVVGLLVLFELPPVVIRGGSLFVGGLFLLKVISVFRGSSKRSQDFSTFEHNRLGDPVTEEFEPPYHCAMPFHSDESSLACYAPVMQVMSGLEIYSREVHGDFSAREKQRMRKMHLCSPPKDCFLS